MTIANIVATPAMIDDAKDLIMLGFRTRNIIIEQLCAGTGANVAQATDAIRAARLSLPFSTSYLI